MSPAPRLCLYNTLTRNQERFESLEPGRVKMFTCGPSIYSRSHVGNYRTFLFEDLLQRYLEYLGCRVERVINFTDVEDKAIAEAARQGRSLEALTEPVAHRFREEAAQLEIKLPASIPRSSTSVQEAVELIELLLAKGYAYRHGRDIFFDPLKYEGFGRLYGLDLSRWPRQKRRFRRDTYPGQRWNLGDFILWHGHRPGEGEGFCWETKLGRGRPAWNIQDPAMIRRHLGERIDLSCGGRDNLFRHHDYNLAIMEAASGRKFASFWLHGAPVLVRGIKMSKSRGNFLYLEQLLGQGQLSPRHLRFFLLGRHYRQDLDFQERDLAAAGERLDRLRGLLDRLLGASSATTGSPVRAALINGLAGAFEERLNDDLDVNGAVAGLADALARLSSLAGEGGLAMEEQERLRERVAAMDEVLRFLLP